MDTTADEALASARAHLAENDNDRAVDDAMLALAQGLDADAAAAAALVAGRAFQGKNMHAESLYWLERCLAVRGDDADALVWRGFARWNLGRTDAALGDFERALAIEPRHARAGFYHGMIRAQRADHARAAELLSLAVDDAELRGAARFERGNALDVLGRSDEARADWRAAADLGHARAAARLADVEPDRSGWSGAALVALASWKGGLRQPDHDGKIAALELASARLDGAARHDALLELAFVLRGLKRWDAALDALRAAAAAHPDGDARAHLGRTLWLADRNRDAETELTAVVADAPRRWLAWQALGELLTEEGRHDEALDAFDRALAVEPARGHLHLLRAHALDKLGRDDDHHAALLEAERQGVEAAGNERRARYGDETGADFFSTATGLLQHRAWAEALEPLEQAAARYRAQVRAPGDRAARSVAGAMSNRGMALASLGRHEEGIVALEEAHRMRPALADPLLNLGNAHLTCGRPARAIECFDQAEQLNPQLNGIPYNRARAHLALGRAAAAVDDCCRALEIGYGDDASRREDAQFNLIRALWKADRLGEARAVCARQSEAGYDLDQRLTALVTHANYEGGLMGQRLGAAIDRVLALGDEPAAPDAYPFRYYGVHPSDWAEGANAGHYYRVGFREPPTPEAKRALAEAFERGWTYLEPERPWRWSGRFAVVNVGEQRTGRFRELFAELADLWRALHDAWPIDEVVSLNAEALSGPHHRGWEWEAWSLRRQRLPSANPFHEHDGHLFFAACAYDPAWPAPAVDDAFEAARREAAARRARAAAEAKAAAQEARDAEARAARSDPRQIVLRQVATTPPDDADTDHIPLPERGWCDAGPAAHPFVLVPDLDAGEYVVATGDADGVYEVTPRLAGMGLPYAFRSDGRSILIVVDGVLWDVDLAARTARTLIDAPGITKVICLASGFLLGDGERLVHHAADGAERWSMDVAWVEDLNPVPDGRAILLGDGTIQVVIGLDEHGWWPLGAIELSVYTLWSRDGQPYLQTSEDGDEIYEVANLGSAWELGRAHASTDPLDPGAVLTSQPILRFALAGEPAPDDDDDDDE